MNFKRSFFCVIIAAAVALSSVFAFGVDQGSQTGMINDRHALPTRELTLKAQPLFYKRAFTTVKKGSWACVSTAERSMITSALVTTLLAICIAHNTSSKKVIAASTGSLIGVLIGYLGYANIIYPKTSEGIFANTEKLYQKLLRELQNDLTLSNLKSMEDVILYASSKYGTQAATVNGQIELAKDGLCAQQEAAQLMYNYALKGLTQTKMEPNIEVEQGLIELKENAEKVFDFVTQKLGYIIEYQKQQRDLAHVDRRELSIKGMQNQVATALAFDTAVRN